MRLKGDIDRAKILRSIQSPRQGQMWSMDFVASVTMFFVVIILVLFAWNYVASENYDQTIISDMQNAGLTVSEVLVRTSGSPPDWNTTAMAIGLASEENIVDESRLRNFLLYMEYNTSRRIMGIRSYEYYFVVKDINDQILQLDGQPIQKGYEPSENVNMIVPIQRYALFQGELAKLEFTVWI